MAEEPKVASRPPWPAEEAWNQGRLDKLDEDHAPNYVQHRPPLADLVGLKAFKDYIAAARASYPDCHLTVDQVVVEGDWSASLWTWGGTQIGVSPKTGAPPTHKYVEFRGCTMSRSVNGKTMEDWEFGDNLGLFQQLGVIPKLPGQA